jgi:hypothetical protein
MFNKIVSRELSIKIIFFVVLYDESWDTTLFFEEIWKGSDYNLLPAKESLVSDIPAGDGKSLTFFYSVLA